MAYAPRRGSATLLWGLLCGIVLGLLIVLDHVVLAGQLRNAALGAGLVSLLLSRGILYMIGLVLFFLGGLLAARRSGAVESGMFAGLIASGLAGLTNLVFSVLAADAVNRRLQRTSAVRRALPAVHAAFGTALFSAVVAFIAVLLIGAGVGALGGLAGRGSTRRGRPFQGSGPAGPFGYPPPPAPQASVSGYPPPMAPASPVSSKSPIPPQSGTYPPLPPGYVPGNDSPTIQTYRP